MEDKLRFMKNLYFVMAAMKTCGAGVGTTPSRTLRNG
jgi:hypothetical protein